MAASIGYMFLFNICFTIALQYLNRKYLFLLSTCFVYDNDVEKSVNSQIRLMQPLGNLKQFYPKKVLLLEKK